MSISVFSINARGLRDLLKRKSLFLYCKGKGVDFYFVQETHACKEEEKFWRSQWGNDIWFSHFSNRSAGVAILKGKFRGQVLSHEIDSLGRMIILHVNIDQTHYTLVNSYATNNRQLNETFFKNIEIKLKKSQN